MTSPTDHPSPQNELPDAEASRQKALRWVNHNRRALKHDQTEMEMQMEDIERKRGMARLELHRRVHDLFFEVLAILEEAETSSKIGNHEEGDEILDELARVINFENRSRSTPPVQSPRTDEGAVAEIVDAAIPNKPVSQPYDTFLKDIRFDGSVVWDDGRVIEQMEIRLLLTKAICGKPKKHDGPQTTLDRLRSILVVGTKEIDDIRKRNGIMMPRETYFAILSTIAKPKRR